MGLGELLDAIRRNYLDQFEATIEQLQVADATIHTEVALRDTTGRAVGEGVFTLPLRIDIVVSRSGNATDSIRVETNRMLTFKQISFTWSDRLQIGLGPFRWDDLAIRVTNEQATGDWKPLQAWFWKWFREEEDGAGEFLGVVHYLADPQEWEGAVEVRTDLGSAPVEAFEELLDALAVLGVSRVELGDTASQ